MRKAGPWIGFVAVVAAIGAWGIYRDHVGKKELEAILNPDLTPQQKLVEADLRPYTEDQYPRLYKWYGAEFVRDRVTKARIEGAQAAAEEGDCDRVEYAEYSDRSQPPSEIVVFVDCRNGFRIYHRDGQIVERGWTR